MHSFTLVDSRILLGLYHAGPGAELTCVALIANCRALNQTVPTLIEFAEAFNKFLYIGAIGITSDRVALTDFGRAIIDSARVNAELETATHEVMGLVHKALSRYKLKSLCNRTLWTPAQYHQAIGEE
jgi:hypothetical protein